MTMKIRSSWSVVVFLWLAVSLLEIRLAVAFSSFSSVVQQQQRQGRRPSLLSSNPSVLQAVDGETDNGSGTVTTSTKDDDGSGNYFFGVVNDAEEKAKASEQADIIKSSDYWEFIEAVWSLSSEIARDMFCAFRRTAANALTASLPEDERQELLERTMGQQKVMQAAKQADEEYAKLLSVQENIAAAKVQEKQQDPLAWEREKGAIYAEAEQAAKERVETELAIQRQRMEQERERFTSETEAAQKLLEVEKTALQELQEDIHQEKLALQAAQQAMEEQESVAEQQYKIEAMEEALKQKEEQAERDKQKMQQLEKKLEQAQQENAVSTTTSRPRIHAGRYSPAEYAELTDDEREQVKALRKQKAATPSTTSSSSVHPILGPVISDLGYKRIHLVSAGKLGTIPIWKKQRIYRHERAKAMVNDKWKSMQLGLPGVICLHENSNGKLAIIDGQHRVGMMMLLRDKQRKDDNDNTPTIDFDRVLVEVYPAEYASEEEVDDDQHAQDLFLEINKAEPVKLVDMPGVASAKDRKVITDAVDQLYQSFPEMFSPSQRCRVPNVNVDNLRNAIYGSNVMKQHNLYTSSKLVEWILDQNAILAKKYENDVEAQYSINPRAWKKAFNHGFYLGLESSWLYN